MILQKLNKWADQQLNRNEELICAKEKSTDKLRYCNIYLKRIKIEDAMVCNNKKFQEDQGKFHRKTRDEAAEREGTLNETIWRVLGKNLGWQHEYSTTKMDEYRCKENRTKSYECAGIHDHWKEVLPNSREMKKLMWSRNQQSAEFRLEKVKRGIWSAILKCLNQRIEQPDKIPDWLKQELTVLLPKTEELGNEGRYCPVTCLNTCYKLFTGMILLFYVIAWRKKQYLGRKSTRNLLWSFGNRTSYSLIRP